jgi:hypothetical protein
MPSDPVDRKAEYATLKRTNPHAAALYLNQHSSAIYPSAAAAAAAGHDPSHPLADVNAFRRWRELSATNPHAAALLMNQSGDAICRGRTLDTEPPEPPSAA